MDIEAEKSSLYENHSSSSSSKSKGCGIFTIRRLKRILKIIFSAHLNIWLLVLICLFALLEQYLVYNVGIIPSGFYKVLGEKDLNGFWLQVLKASLIIIAICFVISCKKYIINVFYVSSREVLTDKLHSMYFNKNIFYIMNTFKYDFTDNPDQRITQDIDKFCKQFSSVINPFVIFPFTTAYYSYNCYQSTGWIGPVGIFLVFLISAVANRLLMKPIMNLIIKQEKCEGNFRFKHMHVRTNAESIAFQDANFSEFSRSEKKLLQLIGTQQSLYLREFPLDISVNIFSYIGSVISYLILALPIFTGKYDNLTPPELSALISVNAFVSIYLISCFSSIINISTTIGELGGLIHRVCEILDAMVPKDKKETSDKEFEGGCILKPKALESFEMEKEPAIQLSNVTFCAPRDSKTLLYDLSLEIKIGTNMLITGNSGSGKTSLFRVIKGLWPILEGHIIRKLPFHPSTIFFLPQHPLLSDGSLIEQLVYPLGITGGSQFQKNEEFINRVISYLRFVDLEHLLEKVGLFDEVEWNWYDVLSPGEMQRLSFVRLFCHRPKLAFLDEATSSIGLQLEEKLYRKCMELGITLISIGHRSSLAQFHNSFLHLDGEGGWTFNLTPVTEL
ncbi:lysosomal cobalamin transporter ABCD4 [Parasteatoda tepidariorum]|uniref:lysosomal cobalamin transporter ABCD4 n=1 Tax=Parasteatoda tepidariorum TaxID=114398 RepID=UPI00077FB631|nr:lysosomal cobalamin transporter ABCD4 [Parasteatoda tepidariorum]